MKRFNIKDNFESVYLREASYNKLSEADKADTLKDPMVLKICQSQARKAFQRYGSVLRVAGFDDSDCYTIAMFWALNFKNFYNHKMDRESNYKFLNNYLKMKFQTILEFVSRKFESNELAPIVSFEQLYRSGDLNDKNLRRGLRPQFISNAPDPETSLTEALSPVLELGDEPARQKTDESYIAINRKKIEDNLEKYAPVLCHYATSKLVHHSVRKKARTYCKKYGIDYQGWLSNKISLNSIHAILNTIR